MGASQRKGRREWDTLSAAEELFSRIGPEERDITREPGWHVWMFFTSLIPMIQSYAIVQYYNRRFALLDEQEKGQSVAHGTSSSSKRFPDREADATEDVHKRLRSLEESLESLKTSVQNLEANCHQGESGRESGHVQNQESTKLGNSSAASAARRNEAAPSRGQRIEGEGTSQDRGTSH